MRTFADVGPSYCRDQEVCGAELRRDRPVKPLARPVTASIEIERAERPLSSET